MAKTSRDTRKKDVETLWTSLVESAFDFFERAVEEHNDSPKYAILHLAASVELFLKARLMAEHWTLIVSPKKPPTFDQLQSGDFVSVTLSEAIERLRGVLPPDAAVTKDAAAEFADLATERNKIAHFFHSGLDGDEKPRNIVQRQCRVWLHLHRLLANVWKDTFAGFDKRLSKLDRKMREERKFLKTIFEDAKPELEKHRKAGHPVLKCPACEFKALALQDTERYTSGQCLVCRYQNTLMRVRCPDCEKDVLIENGYDHCSECGHAFTPHETGALIGGEEPGDDTGHGTLPINCCECGTDEVYEVDGRYVCMNCMQEWDEIEVCEWCSEYNTGDMEGSYLHGCSMCEGMLGWKGDKD
ncbi:MAG: hypothetical protein RIG82_05770 [Phycisphaeraceae bacterium]